MTFTGTCRLRDLLEHLFVLLTVLDDDKHYWVGPEEVDKLLRRGGDWLGAHPDRELIARRYLRHDRRLTSDALSGLLFETLPTGTLRHRNHRFEWTRAEFTAWADDVGSRPGDAVEISGIGPEDADHGSPTQMAVFHR